MKPSAILFSLVLLLPTAAQAKPSKAECKALSGTVRDLAKQLGLSEEITGRALLTTVQEWIDGQDEATIEGAIDQVEQATSGVRQCDAGGFSGQVQAVMAMSRKLESALPWLRNAAAAEPCQALINQAVRKKSSDIDGSIADLERSVRECRDANWLPEAHRNLAAMYYERGSIEKDDYRMAHEQTRLALTASEGRAEEDRRTLAAILARPAIEAGKRLMEQKAYETAKVHWEAYMDLFGTPSFEVLFQVEQVARGAWPLRDLRDARYQLSLACIEAGDVACATRVVLDAVAEYEDDTRPVRELTTRAFEMAAGASETDRETAYTLAFELLAAWHAIDPDSFQIKRLLEETFLDQEREKRLELLRLTGECWIPLQIAEALKQEGETYIEEVEIAATCGGSGDDAQQMLAEFYLQGAYDQLDRLRLAGSDRERRAMLREVEEQLLPKITEATAADEIRSRIAAERDRMRQESATAEQEKVRRYSACTELLATIQWNIARENDYDNELRDFKRGCCQFLMGNASGWKGWMGSKLADAQVEKKGKLMRDYCEPRSD